ncbi:hypothetical protein [Sodalis ligni]|uniref:Uncharacterized protein n=1 Tax=Sodalis ligni TaxID=2697027 RepID=A0A4R1NDJ2_9GAMM|nr:hypothetical protein [Sodalis ligni]TCL03711.1 hypothetical protein EZJ58_1790 [Sodalis ligni]
MIALITSEYLLSPALCAPEEIDLFVEELAQIDYSLDHGLEPRPILENDFIINASEKGLYPCENLFKKNISLLHAESFYSAKDIVAKINSIIRKAKDIAEYTGIDEIVTSNEVQDIKFLSGVELTRKNELLDFLKIISCFKYFNKEIHIGLLHFCESIEYDEVNVIFDASMVSYAGEIFEDLHIENSSFITDKYNNILKAFGSDKFYSRAVGPESLKLAIYVKALELQYSLGGQLNWENFNVSSILFDSLSENQCLYGSRYSALALECMARIIVDSPKYEIKNFTEGANSDQIKQRKGFLAYRTHITKTAIGLRLMFWKNDTGSIILANVGPKQELFIGRLG